uniref:Uncharacterized protein n=1 Tax=Biomphalaria glabrata TaxID=6526 RepID=A0A2C9L657_BIOGL
MKSCTVTNVVKNVIHTAFGVISLVIYEATIPAPTTTSTRKTTTEQTSTSTPTRGTTSSENSNADKSDGNTVSMIVIGVILSSIIIVQFVVNIFLIRRSQGVCVKKTGERKPHIYDQPNKESHYDYIDSCYKSVEI